jgi:cyclohexanone monooxygenase
MPTEPHARRPISNKGYYEVFNQDKASLVSLKETPFTELTRTGAMTSDGIEHKFDGLVLSTGLDAISDDIEKPNLRGRGVHTLKCHWADTPTSYLGFSIPGFPNLFTISGPNRPFTNTPPQLDAQIDFVAGLMEHAGKDGSVEATKEVERKWTELSNKIVEDSLLHQPRGWVFSDNIPGKKHDVLFYFGGLKSYLQKQADVIAKGYEGFNVLKPVVA